MFYPSGTLCHALIISIQVHEFYHFLPSTHHIADQDFALVYFIFWGEMDVFQSETVPQQFLKYEVL